MEVLFVRMKVVYIFLSLSAYIKEELYDNAGASNVAPAMKLSDIRADCVEENDIQKDPLGAVVKEEPGHEYLVRKDQK